ncbi:[FeFe] hydrogenase H-cluster maturation GTPase HydF [Asaccharospora irregularis]|uniref:[FeFe] hydrogenase H-cluster maturation GTPase HydF n=1 Tax=Asaccharospora irregularis DSM 2635 TaxID=1121321 RepID=A0A1M5KVJ1_9FIRM|nr:[FeFe] hydrogenase H-cluster maturation GTPase HydF [Asaccharospora irregularis]SHG56746.1 [FeFe] hydrogenase H-cluster maturation GTPase HydF [Asaccharospora irregularis DSM 2635]
MSNNLNQTPNSDRVHISFFGKTNAGKSSLINVLTSQEVSIVSPIKGTTTDPVKKAMELLPLGPVIIIDTPGIDDKGLVGDLRVKKAKQVLGKTDIAVLVVDSSEGYTDIDDDLVKLFKEKSIPHLVVYNKSDLKTIDNLNDNEIAVSATLNLNINKLKDKIILLAKAEKNNNKIIGDKLSKSDIVVLVTPIDLSAPKGRMILPQVQTIRDIIDSNSICVVTQPEQLNDVLLSLKEDPKMVITDSQVFSKVKDIVPETVLLTSFSIIFARYKGILNTVASGAKNIEKLNDGDTVLICEGCSHHRQCDDIGRVKLPNWIKKHTGKNLKFEFTSGGDFKDDLEKYSLIVHCGGCMLNEREVIHRQNCAIDQNIPFTNYGIIIAYMNGILKRSLKILTDINDK